MFSHTQAKLSCLTQFSTFISACFAAKKPLTFLGKRLSFGGELGTRTPDPLRVMHDDFLIFITSIR